MWLVGLGTGTTNAFAGWTPSPTTGSGPQSAKAAVACAHALGARAHDAKPVLTETRGPFTAAVYSNSATCVSGPGFTSASGVRMMSGYAYGGLRGIQFDAAHVTTRDGHAYTMVQGRAAADVKSATLELSDGSRIKATVANGWYAAWWPGTHDAVRAELATPSGTRVQMLRTGGMRCTGPGPCTLKAGPGSGPSTHVGP